MRLTRPGADATARGGSPNASRKKSIAGRDMGLTMIRGNATVSRPDSPSTSIRPRGEHVMRRFALLLLAGASSLVSAPPGPLLAQGFGVYEQNTCTMGRAGVAAARPCADGSAIFFNPAGLAGISGNRLSVGTTLIAAHGGFTDDLLGTRTALKNPVIPAPNLYITHQINPKFTAGIGLYAPYGLETKWDPNNFSGRFLGYNTDVRSIYIQPTVGYEISPRLKVGVGVAYITSRLTLRQRADLSSQLVPPSLAALFPAPGLPAGTTFGMLGVPTGTDFADANLHATGSGFAVNFGGIFKVSDRLSIGGHWLTRKTIKYSGTATFAPESTHLFVPATIGTCPDGSRHEQMRRFGGEGGCAAVLDGFPREPMPADTQAIADFENAAEIDGESATGGMQVRVREVGARWNAEHPEGGPGRQTRCGEERSERGRNQL